MWFVGCEEGNTSVEHSEGTVLFFVRTEVGFALKSLLPIHSWNPYAWIYLTLVIDPPTKNMAIQSKKFLAGIPNPGITEKFP